MVVRGGGGNGQGGTRVSLHVYQRHGSTMMVVALFALAAELNKLEDRRSGLRILGP